MNTDAPVSVSWQSEHETLGITLSDIKIHVDFKIEMWISILKCPFQYWTALISKLKCTFQYWNAHFNIEICTSILKFTFQYWNLHWFQNWNAHFNIEIHISILKSTCIFMSNKVIPKVSCSLCHETEIRESVFIYRCLISVIGKFVKVVFDVFPGQKCPASILKWPVQYWTTIPFQYWILNEPSGLS